MKIKITTWKIGPQRYLHQIKVTGGWFTVITNSDIFDINSRTIIRNTVSQKKKEFKGYRFVREQDLDRLGEDNWALLCFGGDDGMELRKKIYGRELREVKLKILVYSSGIIGGIYVLDKKFSSYIKPTLIRQVQLRRSLNKRIKDQLSSIIINPERVEEIWGEEPKIYYFTATELSYIRFLQRLEQEKNLLL